MMRTRWGEERRKEPSRSNIVDLCFKAAFRARECFAYHSGRKMKWGNRSPLPIKRPCHGAKCARLPSVDVSGEAFPFKFQLVSLSESSVRIQILGSLRNNHRATIASQPRPWMECQNRSSIDRRLLTGVCIRSCTHGSLGLRDDF